jgi:hypothetical protein
VVWYGQEVREDKITSRRLHILRECPKTFISQFSRDVIELYLYSMQFNNALPEAGGINDQNATVMQALSIVRAEMHKVEMWQQHVATTKADKNPPQTPGAASRVGRKRK